MFVKMSMKKRKGLLCYAFIASLIGIVAGADMKIPCVLYMGIFGFIVSSIRLLGLIGKK